MQYPSPLRSRRTRPASSRSRRVAPSFRNVALRVSDLASGPIMRILARRTLAPLPALDQDGHPSIGTARSRPSRPRYPGASATRTGGRQFQAGSSPVSGAARRSIRPRNMNWVVRAPSEQGLCRASTVARYCFTIRRDCSFASDLGVRESSNHAITVPSTSEPPSKIASSRNASSSGSLKSVT